MLKTSLTTEELTDYIAAQLQSFFPDGKETDKSKLQAGVKAALQRYEKCVEGVTRKYFTDEAGHGLYNHLQSDQNAMFLYMLCRDLHLKEEQALATKVYYLNKVLHSIDVMYTVDLPEKFIFSHCVGTVLGKAKYGNYLRVGQNCTIGNDRGQYPVLGEGVALYKGSLVVGTCNIGNNVHISAHSFVRNTDIPDNSIVIGNSPALTIKKASVTVQDRYFYPH
jgi:serine O-acetyltransferase